MMTMSEYFSLSSNGSLRVKAVTSSSRGEKGLIRIELETLNLEEMGWALRQLNAVIKAQAQPKKKPVTLALPHPKTVHP
jgi:hypothetical protein